MSSSNSFSRLRPSSKAMPTVRVVVWFQMKANSQSVHSSATGFQLFREHLTNLLLSVFSSVDTSEEGLKEALGKLVAEFREHKVVRDLICYIKSGIQTD